MHRLRRTRRGEPHARHDGGHAPHRRFRADGCRGPLGHERRPHERPVARRPGPHPERVRRGLVLARGVGGRRHGRCDAEAGHRRHGVRRGDPARLGPREGIRAGRCSSTSRSWIERWRSWSRSGRWAAPRVPSVPRSPCPTTPRRSTRCSPRPVATPVVCDVNIDPELLDDLEWRGLIAHSTDRDALREALTEESVRFYVGFDPTAPSLHMGNLVQLLTAKRLQLRRAHAVRPGRRSHRHDRRPPGVGGALAELARHRQGLGREGAPPDRAVPRRSRATTAPRW